MQNVIKPRRAIFTIITIVLAFVAICSVVCAFTLEYNTLKSWGAHYYVENYSDHFISIKRKTHREGWGTPVVNTYNVLYWKANKTKILNAIKDEYIKADAEFKKTNPDCIQDSTINYEQNCITANYVLKRDLISSPGTVYDDSENRYWIYRLNNIATLYYEIANDTSYEGVGNFVVFENQ